jgi:hypothetical protein
MPVILTLICFGAVAAGFWMIDRNETLNQSLAQPESHVQELIKRLDALTIAQAQVPVAKPVSRATKKGAALRKPAVAKDPRVDKFARTARRYSTTWLVAMAIPLQRQR